MILGFDTATDLTTVAVLAGDGDEVVHAGGAGAGPGRPAGGRLGAARDGRRRGRCGRRLGADRDDRGRQGPGIVHRAADRDQHGAGALPGPPVAGRGVDTTAALAAGLADDERPGGRPRIGVVDARRGEVFAAVDRGDGPANRSSLLPIELVAALGGDVEGAIAAGDGAVRFRTEIEATGLEASRLTTILRTGSRRGRSAPLAAKMGPGSAHFPAGVTPKYMRRPDAERWLERNDGS